MRTMKTITILMSAMLSASATAAVTYSFELRYQPPFEYRPTTGPTRIKGAITLPNTAFPIYDPTSGTPIHQQFTSWNSCSFIWRGTAENCSVIEFSEHVSMNDYDTLVVKSAEGHTYSYAYFAGGAFTERGSYYNADPSIPSEFFTRLSVSIPGVPEPATWGMLLIGLGVSGQTLRLRRRHAAGWWRSAVRLVARDGPQALAGDIRFDRWLRATRRRISCKRCSPHRT